MNILRFLITPAAVLLGCFGGSYIAVRTLNTETIQAQAAKDPKAKPDVVVASGLAVVDEDGKIRFGVSIVNNETVLRLFGPDEASQIVFSAGKDSADFKIWHGEGFEQGAQISTSKEETGIELWHGVGKDRSEMRGTFAKGDASVLVASSRHGATARTIVADGTASLRLDQFVKPLEQEDKPKESTTILSSSGGGGALKIYSPHYLSEKPDDVARLVFNVDGDDMGMSLISPNRQAQTNFFIDKNGAMLFLTRSFGAGTKLKDVNVSLTATDTGSALLLGGVKEHKETIAWPRVIAGVNEEGAGTVEVYDKNGKVAWMTPKK